MAVNLVVLTDGADLDALSSALGVLKLYPNTYLLKPKKLSKSAARVFKDFSHLFKVLEEIPPSVDRLILVDNHSLDRVEKIPFKRLVIFDHHTGKELKIDTPYEGKIAPVGAATTLVVQELQKQEIPITPEEATVLAFGIYEDTGSFMHLGTQPEDLQAAAYLLSKGADLNLIKRYVEEPLSKEQIEVVYNLLRSIEYITTPEGFRIAVATFKGENYIPDFQQLVYQLKEFQNLDGFFIIFEGGGKTYVFGRANNEKFNAADVLKKLGGGGHPEASSLKVEGIPAQRIQKRLREILEGKLENLYVERFMSSPPLVIPISLSAKEALQKLVDFGFAAAPVVDEEGRPLGVIYKKELLKVLSHLPDAKVEDVYNPDIKVLHKKDTIWEAEEILSKFGKKLIPIVDDLGKVVGVITRIDIMRNILEEIPHPERKGKLALPANIKEFARRVGVEAQKLGMKAYIVGGVVRDIILGKPVWDLDIVVEGGNSIDLAKRLGEIYGVKVHPFEDFKTAHMKLGNLKIEFATARRERYKKSGDYPQIEPASLKEDILRRDFTINTMAVALNPEEFETLIDYLGGYEDLEKGIIRALHSASFIEDPVRILRGLRFAGRFNFEIAKATRTQMKQAVALGLLKKAPKGRIANELRLAMREEHFPRILELYRKYKILEQILPEGFQWSMVKLESLQRLQELLSKKLKHITTIPGWVLFLNLLLGLKKEDALKVLKELSAPSKVVEIYTQVKEKLAKIQNEVLKAQKPSDLVKALKPFHPETLLIVAARSQKPIEEAIVFYLEKLKDFKPKVEVDKYLKQGLKGKELGEAIEKEKSQILDKTFNPQWEELKKTLKR
ncbi:MAG: CBS domain-containing protein [Aquificae bacterium]|nr:CBS domain-containing protein [Aquificota bacterium]